MIWASNLNDSDFERSSSVWHWSNRSNITAITFFFVLSSMSQSFFPAPVAALIAWMIGLITVTDIISAEGKIQLYICEWVVKHNTYNNNNNNNDNNNNNNNNNNKSKL